MLVSCYTHHYSMQQDAVLEFLGGNDVKLSGDG